ncbi:MAG: hypothetical protein JWP88_1938 [Flaviaesturariibacter sp.]|nr:hypothetical protein [Flaviaesturariibacter sp.]
MKRILLVIAIVSVSLSSFAAAPDVDTKVLDAFNKTFPDVQDVSWSATALSYEVKFKLNEISTHVTYDKQGNALQTLRYYGETQLPMLVLTKVKSRFADKKIFGVTELTTGDETIYHIVLEDEKGWVNIQSNACGNIEVKNRFKKA